LGMNIHAVDYPRASAQTIQWAAAGESRVVCAANVHMVMEGWDDPAFRSEINHADMVTPDGMPLVWSLRHLGAPDQPRVYGPELMLHICRQAMEAGVSVGLFGATPETLTALKGRLVQMFPDLDIPYAGSPPFRELSDEEQTAVRGAIDASGAKILFVALGCPKQEKWMAAHRGRINAVMIGVGAAFDFHTGRVRQAPGWMQRAGLEWLFRLSMEPARLWRRYLYHNPRFVILLGLQFLGLLRHRPS